ncbi:MAG: hypothetical protein R3190_18770, partial [Thermoanaerobaculia bacterium]|nr:hypothetical protein [Thermoanaerobaculia bacterium]
MISLLFLLSLLATEVDPRPRLVTLQAQNQEKQALAAARELRRENPELAEELGLDYLEGRLL